MPPTFAIPTGISGVSPAGLSCGTNPFTARAEARYLVTLCDASMCLGICRSRADLVDTNSNGVPSKEHEDGGPLPPELLRAAVRDLETASHPHGRLFRVRPGSRLGRCRPTAARSAGENVLDTLMGFERWRAQTTGVSRPMSANRVNSGRKVISTRPIAPCRCLAMFNSAIPLASFASGW